MSDGPSAVKGIAGGLLFLLLGAAIAGGGVYLYQDASQATESAVEVDATVVSSSVGQKTNSGGQGGQTDVVYYPRIEYEYTYEGRTYTSTNICPGAGSECQAAQNKGKRSEVESFLADYQAGETVTAYVPPGEPSGAYLVAGTSPDSYVILVGFGALILLAGLGVLLSSVRNIVT